MEMIYLPIQSEKIVAKYNLPISKSEINRWLVLQYLLPDVVDLKAISEAEDSQILFRILQEEFRLNEEIDCGAAGTVYRFLTALSALSNGSRILTGSKRLMERPIAPLVNALRQLGASIEYLDKEGFGPIAIEGKPLAGGVVDLDNTSSSQFVTALMLIVPSLPKGLEIRHSGLGTSAAYIYMTALILEKIGCKVKVLPASIQVSPPSSFKNVRIIAEADWSAASYAYGKALLANTAEIYLPGLRLPSFQGDSRIAEYFSLFGIETIYTGGGVRLRKDKSTSVLPNRVEWNFSDTPDLAQTCIVSLAALGQPFHISGLHTLPTKETDRLRALKLELAKVGIELDITRESCSYSPRSPHELHISKEPLQTYDDHRMAMSLSILAMKLPISIANPEVVAKSFPDFWREFF